MKSCRPDCAAPRRESSVVFRERFENSQTAQAPAVLGAFTGLAGFFGGMMNWNFIMAGSASTNGLLFVIATWLVLAWRNAGWIGLDRWLLPLAGTPWKGGRLFRSIRTAETT